MARKRKQTGNELFRMVEEGSSHRECRLYAARDKYACLIVETQKDGRKIGALFSGPKTLRALAFAILDATGGRGEP